MQQWDPPWAYAASLDAGNRAMAAGNWQASLEAYQTALAVRETGEVLEGIANAAWWLDDVSTLFAFRERAYAAYRFEGDQSGSARVAIWLSLDYHIFRNASAIANGWLQRARTILSESNHPTFEHGLLEFAHGHIALENFDFDAVERHSRRSGELARQVGVFDLEMLSMALRGLGLVSTGDVARGMSMLDEAVAAATGGEVDDPDSVVTICCYLFYACERVQDFRRASEWCEVLIDLCRRWDYRSMVAVCRGHYASVLIWQGDWERAESELTSSTNELLSTRAGWAPEGLIRLAQLRRLQGRSEVAAEIYRHADDHPFSLLGRAELAFDSGDLPLARDLVDRFLRRIPTRAVTDRTDALDLRLELAIQLDDPEVVRSTHDELVQTAESIATGPVRATALRASGRVAASEGDLQQARRLLEDAIDLFVSSNAVLEAARTRVDLARVLTAVGRESVAAAERSSAIAVFERIGAGPDLTRARGLLHQIPDTIDQVPADEVHYPGLSRRESQILWLIAAGHTNPEIAEALFLSVRTVERHVSSIYQKIGAEGKAARAVATAYALEHASPRS